MKSLLWLMALVVFTVTPMTSRLARLAQVAKYHEDLALQGDKESHRVLVAYNNALKGRIQELEAELDEAYESLNIMQQFAREKVVADQTQNS